MKSLADLLLALEEEVTLAASEASRGASKELVVLGPCEDLDPQQAAVTPAQYVMNTAALQRQVLDASMHLNLLRTSHSHPVQEMDTLRSRLLDLRTRLMDMLFQCGVDNSSVIALTESAECDDLSDLYSEVPTVWVQTTDSKNLIHERTIQLRLLQQLSSLQKQIAIHTATTMTIVSLTKREKRLRNDLDECRVVVEFIRHVNDRIEHVERMVVRQGIDEAALLDLHKTTIMEEERAKFHVAGNDIRGLKAITNGHKMQSIKQAAILPEVGSLEALLRKKSSTQHTLFPDIGICHAAWRDIEDHCETIIDMVTGTRETHATRRIVADSAYEIVMQSLATRAIASIR